ncbi:MAG: HAD family phosphatase [Armatimonadetes bacterium]|nr:HAD family phosphatase [Armatimonadota bacterium]
MDNRQSPKAIIFDLDGTLIDSEPWHKRSEVEALRGFGVELTEQDLEPYMGTTLPDMLARLEKTYGKPLPVNGFLAVQRPSLVGFIRQEMRLYADAAACLDRVSGRRLALATSSMRWYMDEVFRRFSELKGRFEATVCEADIRHSKPHPEIFLKAAAGLGLRPEQCTVVEDSPSGVLAARRAGCRVVGIERAPGRDLSAAHVLIRSLNELEAALAASHG